MKKCHHFIKRNHVSIWNWIQKYRYPKVSSKRKKIDEFIIDETMIKVSSQYVWLWFAIESNHRQILLQIDISFERNMFIAERFLSNILEKHGKHPVSTEMVTHDILFRHVNF